MTWNRRTQLLALLSTLTLYGGTRAPHAVTDTGDRASAPGSGSRLLYASSFGSGGKVVTPLAEASISNFANALQVQPDGKLVAAGYSYSTNGNDFALIRYTAGGRLDTGFGTGGRVITPVVADKADNVATSLLLQPDGKLVAAGYTSNVGGATGYDFALIRYTAGGRLDQGFGKGGKVITPVGSGKTADFASVVRLQPDGKLVVAGYSTSSVTANDFALARYNANGTLDTSFGTGGRVTTPLGGKNSSDAVNGLQVQADGKLVVVGSTGVPAEGTVAFALVRYNASGSLDATFGQGGKVITRVGGTNSRSFGSSLYVQPDGKLVVVGTTGIGDGTTGYAFALVRYAANGRLDQGFGTGGMVITTVGGTNSAASASALQVQPDGKFVAAGYTREADRAADTHFAVVRYTTNGRLDANFGNGGKVITQVGGVGKSDIASALAIQRDGRLVVAGTTGDGRGTTGNVVLVRYNADGSLDTGFGVGTGAMTPATEVNSADVVPTHQ